MNTQLKNRWGEEKHEFFSREINEKDRWMTVGKKGIIARHSAAAPSICHPFFPVDMVGAEGARGE